MPVPSRLCVSHWKPPHAGWESIRNTAALRRRMSPNHTASGLFPGSATCWSMIRRQNRSRSSALYTPAVTCRKHSRSCGDLPAMPIQSKTKSLVAIILCEIDWLLHVRIAMFSPKASKVGQFQWAAADSN